MYVSPDSPVGYSQLYQYPLTKPINEAPAGGRTIQIIAVVVASGILIGMALGLGLGIGAAGIVNGSGILTIVTTPTTNTTAANSTVTNSTTVSSITIVTNIITSTVNG